MASLPGLESLSTDPLVKHDCYYRGDRTRSDPPRHTKAGGAPGVSPPRCSWTALLHLGSGRGSAVGDLHEAELVREDRRLHPVAHPELGQQRVRHASSRCLATPSRPPISALDRPRATSSSTSRSRAVSPLRPGAVRRAARARRTPRSAAGSPRGRASRRPRRPPGSPRAARSGGASLSRNPDAPARSASKTYASRSKVVSTSTRAAAGAAVIRGSRSSPSSAGHPDVHQYDVRAPARASATASAPSPASPTTSMSGSAPRSAAKPGADDRLVVGREDRQHHVTRSAPAAGRSGPARSRRQAGPHREAAAGPGAGIEVAAEEGGPLPHAGRGRAPRAVAVLTGRSRRRRPRGRRRRGRSGRSPVVARAGPAIRSTFVSASCTMR